MRQVTPYVPSYGNGTSHKPMIIRFITESFITNFGKMYITWIISKLVIDFGTGHIGYI